MCTQNAFSAFPLSKMRGILEQLLLDMHKANIMNEFNYCQLLDSTQLCCGEGSDWWQVH